MRRQTQIILIFVLGVLGLGTGFWVVPQVIRVLDSDSTGSPVSWASSVMTIAEQAQEADLIVYVRAESVEPPRMLVFGKGEQTEEIAQAEGYEVKGMPFTDTRMRVLAVYKGDVLVNDTITVMQTGGTLPGIGESLTQTIQLEGNPIFVQGAEYILFLKDISGDSVHAPDRELYRIINSASRYDIQGEQVKTYADTQLGHKFPTTLDALLDEIKQAVDTR